MTRMGTVEGLGAEALALLDRMLAYDPVLADPVQTIQAFAEVARLGQIATWLDWPEVAELHELYADLADRVRGIIDRGEW
jgi:hypothetical protein